MASDALRFEFGKNWLNFLSTVTDESIGRAEQKLSQLVGDIKGKRILDVGCGSGLDSLACIRLGADELTGIDFDSQSVQCSLAMKSKFAPNAKWSVLQGSALDETFLRGLGKFDLVYSWGVLHHTGDMWKALDLITIPARSQLLVSLYADQGIISQCWRILKASYNHFPASRPFVTAASLATLWLPKLRKPHRVISEWKNYSEKRGMSAWHDVIDWAGGYPYEVAKPEQVTSFYAGRGFSLKKQPPSRGIIRINEYLFERTTA